MPTRVGHFPSGFMTSGNKAKFEIHDPFGVREVVQPIVSISNIEEKITGLGTCFQISPWSWLTAHHVVIDRSGGFFPPDEVGAVGFSPGLIFGTVGFKTPEYFAPITGISAAVSKDEIRDGRAPMPKGLQLDVATLKLDKTKLKRVPLTSPLPIARRPPEVGDQVFGIGFPILGSSMPPNRASMLFSERMYGAGGTVTKLHPHGVAQSRPWPTIEVEGDWASGMSGGPVIDMTGSVVGVISSSFAPTDEHPGVGFAVSISELPLDWFAPELDPSNPGWARGWGVFQNEQMIGFFETELAANASSLALKGSSVAAAACNPKTESWMKI